MDKMLKKTTVLVLEDDPLIALDAAMSIEDQGFACVVAYDPDAALEILAAQDIDCALLDFDLGSRTSVPVAQALDCAGRPYLIVTGRRQAEVAEQLRDDVVVKSKPVDYARLALQLIAVG